MRVPVVLLTGVDPDAMASAVVGLLWDLPRAVAVRHHIDPHEQTLTRVVSDATGVLEREVMSLEHACVSCAIREDIAPTLERLARSGQWQSIVAHLPVGAEARQVCRVLTLDSRMARHLRVASLIVALRGDSCVADLLGDALLRERGLHSAQDDARGVGETACAMVELADVVVTVGEAGDVADALLRTLARPDALHVPGVERLQGSVLTGSLHQHEHAFGWASPYAVPEGGAPVSPEHDEVWQVELRSVHPFHPERLLRGLEQLGGGHHRSRGCFWLPTRALRRLVWDGSGGQLSVGSGEPWAGTAPFTRLLLTGVGVRPDGLQAAFEAMLLPPDEAAGRSWQVHEDGFEPWLGPLRDVA